MNPRSSCSMVRKSKTLVDVIGLHSLSMIALIGFGVISVCLSINNSLSGQPPVEDQFKDGPLALSEVANEFQIRQVFVPESDLSVLGDSFVPTDRKRLVELINEALQREAGLQTSSTPHISEAIYVARLVGQDLVSNASRWMLVVPSTSDKNESVWTVPETSIAWRPIPAITESQLTKTQTTKAQPAKTQPPPPEYSDSIRFRPDGVAEFFRQESGQSWIAWSARGKWNDNRSQIRFSLNLPNAIRAKLILDLPPGWSIVASENIATKLNKLDLAMPSDWPRDLTRSYTNGNWWAVHVPVTGQSSFTIGKDSSLATFPFSGVLKSQHNEYNLTERGLEISSSLAVDYSFDGGGTSTIEEGRERYDALLVVDTGLGITEVLVDGVPQSWKAGDSPNTIVVSIEKPLTSAIDQASMLTVKGIGAWVPEDKESKLPTIRWDRRFVLNGSSSVRLSQAWTATTIRTDSQSTISASDTNIENVSKELHFVWQGTPPNTYLRAAPTVKQEPIDAFTRIINTNDGFTATTRVLLPKRFVNSDSFTVETDRDWTLESVQPLDASKANATFRNRTDRKPRNPGGLAYELTVSTVLETQPLSIEIVCKKAKGGDVSRPLEKPFNNEAILTLETCRPLVFVDFQQSDFYLLEATGRYTIDGSAELIESRVSESEIPASYRQMLPRMEGFWLIKPILGIAPKLTFCRQTAPYTAELHTRISPSSDRDVVQTQFTISCTPVAGTVNSVLVSLSSDVASRLNWKFRSGDNEESEKWIPIESVQIDNPRITEKTKSGDPKKSTNLDGIQRFRLLLPEPCSSSFELHSTQRSSLHAPVELPLVPEANQSRARLDVESHLTIADLPKVSLEERLQPQGFWFDEGGLRYMRFLYAQSPDFRVLIVPKNHAPDAWVSKSKTSQRILPDGTREAIVTLNLQQSEATVLQFALANDWRIRSVSLNSSQSLQVIPSRSSSSPGMVLLPQQKSDVDPKSSPSLLTFVIDGQPISLLKAGLVDWPKLQPDCKVLSQEFALTIPHDTLLVSKEDTVFPTWDDALSFLRDLQEPRFEKRFSASRWLRNSPIAFIGERSTETTTQVLDTNETYLLPLDSGRVWHWIVIVTVFLSTVWLSRYSPAICLLTIGLLFSSLLVAPEFAVDWIQAITTSAILGGMFILTHRLVDEKRAAHTKGSGKQVPNNTNGQSKSIPATKVTTLSALLIAFSFAQGTGLAQNEADSLQEEATDQKPFYSVVFPVDDSGNMTGDISYVGEDFLKWLNRRKGLPTARNHVLSAKHEVVIDNSLEGNFATPSCLVTSVYEWNVQDQEEVIRVVLPGDKSTIINISINGVEQSIPSDVASTNAIVELRPRALSLTEVRIKFRIPVSLDVQNLSSVRFPVLPNPNATADILGVDTADLQTNAIGQVTNPSTGRHMIALGKQSELLIRWRQGLPRIVSVSEPVSVEMEWSVACNESVIRCMINCPGQAIEPNYLDVECDQNWEPLGFDWEDGKVVDVFAGSTNLKKRFRIQWKDASDPSRRQLRFFLHKKHDSNTSLISLPTVGISNAIIETRSVVIAQGGPCRWEVNRSRGWVDANPESSFQWLTRESEITQSFKTQDSSATLSIQPITTTNLPSVAMVSNLLFGSHSITGHTQFQLDPLAKSTNELVLVASPLTHLLSIHSEGKELHHLESTLEDGTHRIQVFVDRSNVKSGNFQIEFQQNYSAIDKWINLPTIMITNANVSSHQITAARLLDVPVEFDGIERPGFSRTTDGSYKKPSQDDKLPNQKTIVNLNPPVASALPFQLFQSGRTPNESGVTTAAMNAIHEHLWLFDAKPSTALGGIGDSGQDSLSQLRYRIRSTQDELRGYCISVLTPEGDAWKYRLLGSVSSKDTIQEGLLFEMPVEIASSFTSENSLFQFDSPEPGKRLLLVYSKRSPTTENTTELTEPFVFSIECQLDTEHAVNGIRVPEVRLLNGPSVEQWIAVPKSASGRKLTWTTSGVRNSKQAPEVTSVLNIPSSELSWFSSFSQQPEVRLNSLSSAPTIPKVPLAFHRFQPLDSDVAQLDSFFVVEPQGVSFVSLKLPSRMELLSVFVNEETSPFRVETDINNDGKLSLDIPLQSSAFPQCVKAVFKVPTSQNQIKGASQEVVLPILRGLNPAKTVIELDQSYVARDQLLQSKSWENLSHEGLDELILNVVTSCSKRFTETSSDLNLPQRNRWWAAWQAIATELLFPTAEDLITKSVDRWIALRDLMHSQWRLDVLSQADGFIQPNGTELVEITPQKNFAFVLDTTIENNPRIQISQTTSTASTRSVKAVVFATFGLLIMIVAVVPVLRNLLYRMTDFVMECLQIRPWLLFATCGAIICLSSSHALAGFALLAVAFVLVLRQYVYQFRILASRSASKI